MPGKLYVKTFGCQMNEYDSAKMADVLAVSYDFTVTENPAPVGLAGLIGAIDNRAFVSYN